MRMIFRLMGKFFLLVLFLALGAIAHYFKLSFAAPAYMKMKVRDALPEFELTTGFLGYEIVPAKVFAVDFVQDASFEKDPSANLRKFLSQYNDHGLPAFRLLLRTGIADQKYWPIDLPGCRPTRCLDTGHGNSLTSSTEEEWDYFSGSSSNPGGGLVPVYDVWLFGVNLTASVSIGTNGNGEIVFYNISTSRTATVNPIDRTLAEFGGNPGVLSQYIFRKNLSSKHFRKGNRTAALAEWCQLRSV